MSVHIQLSTDLDRSVDKIIAHTARLKMAMAGRTTTLSLTRALEACRGLTDDVAVMTQQLNKELGEYQ